jgi:hypothetical protein
MTVHKFPQLFKHSGKVKSNMQLAIWDNQKFSESKQYSLPAACRLLFKIASFPVGLQPEAPIG